MKTKIISLLLLVSMLITAVPVMAAAAEEAPESTTTSGETVEYVDLHTLYVQDGLQNLFTTFGENPGYDLSAGKWTAKVGTGVATLGEKARWSKNELGGIGYGAFYGTMINGTYVAKPEGDNAQYNFNNVNTTTMKLNFGISLLPKEDFTVEYFAMYKPIYVADMDGNIALDANGNRIEAYNKNGSNTPSGGQNTAVDAYGWFTTFAVNIDGKHNLSGSVRSGVGWFFKLPSWYAQGGNGDQGAWKINALTCSSSKVFQQNHLAATYSVSVDETVETDAEGNRTVSALVSLYRDGALHAQNLNSTANIAAADLNGDGKAVATTDADGKKISENWGSTYVDAEWTSAQNFWIAAQRPIDFYGARIYNRALTEAEKTQNHAVDVLLYYNVKIETAVLESELIMAEIYRMAAETAVEADVIKFAGAANALQTQINHLITAKEMIELYAAPEHLTSLFSAFVADTVDLKNGKWEDIIGNEYAILQTYGSAKWTYADNAVSVTHFYGQVGADKVSLVTSANTNTVGTSSHFGTRLQLGLALLPKDDFTIDYTARYMPLYVATADGKIETFTKEFVEANGLSADLIGKSMEVYEAQGGYKAGANHGGVGSYEGKGNIDYIGFIASRTVRLDGIYVGHHVRGNVAWTLNGSGSHSWGTSCDWVGAAAFNGGLRGSKDIREVGVAHTYTIMRDENLTVADDGTRTVTAVYTLMRDGVLTNSAYKSPTLSTANTANGMYYWDKDDEGNFWLSASQPIEYYALRIYDIALTDEQLAHNHLVDLLRYYDIDISGIRDDEERLNTLFDRIAAVPFESDTVKKQATAQYLQAMVDSMIKAPDIVESYARSEHLVGFFTTFIDDMVNMKTGKWTNLVGATDATLVSPNRWFTNANGSIGYNVWSGKIADDGTVTSTGSGGAFGFDETNFVYTREGHLDLGLALLPDGDLTVELVAMTRPILMADAEESSASKVVYAWDAENGKYYETAEMVGNAHCNIGDHGSATVNGWLRYGGGAIDAIGRFGSFDVTPDGAYWVSAPEARGNLGWMNTITGWTVHSGLHYSNCRVWLGDDQYLMADTSDPFMTLNTVRTYTYTLDETQVEGSDEVKAIFSIYRDAFLYRDNKSQPLSTKGTTQGTLYNNSDYVQNDSRFYFGSSRPTDFFALRVYDVVLTTEEKEYNHVRDVYYYYELTIPEELWDNDEFLAELGRMLSGCAIAKGVVEKTAEKIRLQGALDSLVSLYAGERDDYASLYAAENLVGLFFADTSLSSATGVWYNKVENGENATLRDTSGRNYWRRKDNGIGYSMTFSQWGAGNQYREVGLSLPDSYAEFESFTVEAFAKVEGTTTATGERYVASGEAYKNWCSAFRLGLLTSLFFGNAKTATSGLGLRWGLSMTGWTGGIYNGTNGAYNIFSADDHSWIQMGPMMTPTAGVMQLTKNVKTETVDGASVTNITYGLAYNNKSGKSYTIDEAKHEGYLHYFDGDNMNFNSGAAKAYGEYADPFSLFNGVPATIYAVRVYDGLLTADEKAQNRLVDLMYYHDVAVPAGLTHDSEAMKTIAACANGITISEDAVAKAANKATIEAAIAAASSKVNIVAGADAQETIYAVGSTYTLPTMIDGQAVVAWTASNATGSYLPGASIALTNDMTVTAVVIDAPKTNSKVSIKPMSSSDGLAIRFTADFVRADMEAILDLYENVTVGMLIAPVRYVQAAGGIFTREALRAYVVENGVAADRAFVEVVATGFYVIGEETLTLAASLANFSNTTKAKNPDFTAVAFVDIDADNDGVVDYTVYGSYNALAKHNVKTVMQKALGGALTDTQKNWINSLLKEFGA